MLFWDVNGDSCGDALSKGQRLPLPICKTLTNQVWMAAGHPKPSLGSLKLCFEMSTAKTFQMRARMAVDHIRTFWRPEIVFSGVICGCCCCFENKNKNGRCWSAQPSKTRSRWQKPSQTDFCGLEIMFWGVNGDSDGSEIVWFLALWQGTGVVSLENLPDEGCR